MSTCQEGSLQFELRNNIKTPYKLDEIERTLKAVDFVIQFSDEMILIEVKDPEGTIASKRDGQIKAVFSELENDTLIKQHLLPKLYGSFAYFVMTNCKPLCPVRYLVLICLADLTMSERTTVTNKLQRIIVAIGPVVATTTHRPVVEVHNLESWARNHPNITITRVAPLPKGNQKGCW